LQPFFLVIKFRLVGFILYNSWSLIKETRRKSRWQTLPIAHSEIMTAGQMDRKWMEIWSKKDRKRDEWIKDKNCA